MTRTPILASLLLAFVAAAPFHAARAVVRAPNDLLDEYDFIVVGAGTAGLTLADRLSESGDYTILAVEYGYLDSSLDIVTTGPGSAIIGINAGFSPSTRFYNITSERMPGFNNRSFNVAAGCIVGGSSAVNGMVFDRGSADDYDAWVWAAGEKHAAEYSKEWGWKNLYPYFKKSVTFHPPTQQMVDDYQMTYDEAAYGGDTPIHSSYPPFQWPTQQKVWNAFKSVPGVVFPKEHADGNAVGVVWTPNSIDPLNRTRSYAKLGHWDANSVSARRNFHLLPAHRVTQLLMEETDGAWTASGVYIAPRDGPLEKAKAIKAKREVIVSAGSIHTPQILQRSGIGPRDVLTEAGVPIRVELPGVGANLQDHGSFQVSFRWQKPSLPDQSTLSSNATYAAEATELWVNNRTGPLAAFVSSMALLPLSVFSNRTDTIVTSLLSQAADPASLLPAGTHPTVVAGYAAQLKALARQFASRGTAVLEMPFSGRAGFSMILLKLTSRGRIRISPRDDGVNITSKGNLEPIVDWRSLSNPLDGEIYTEFLKWVRLFAKSPAMVEAFDPIETAPGPQVADDDAILAWIRTVTGPSNGHPVGTAALAPLELGGVVGPDLTVHRVKKLSVADNSIMTIIPGTHTSSTAYAIGEKAADLVLRRAKL